MPAVTIDQIEARLRGLPPEKLMVVYDFVSFLAERGGVASQPGDMSEAHQLMIASETSLRRDWDRPEEDEAWANL